MADSVTLALDLGTTSIKAAILSADGELTQVNALPAPALKGHDGRYESDAWAYLTATNQLLEKYLRLSHRVNLGLCCQRSSFVIWDKASGKPVTPLISWQDNRGVVSCKNLQAEEPLLQKLTGLRLTPYYFAPKLQQLLQDQPELRQCLESGNLLVGMLDTFMIWHWSNRTAYQTDVSMAARTLLMDIQTQQWSSVLCDVFTIPQHILPEIRPSSGMNVSLLQGTVMLQASVADQSAAVISSIHPDSTETLINLGTGGFVICCPTRLENQKKAGYLNTLVFQEPESRPRIAVEGTLNSIALALAPIPYKSCHIANLGLIKDIFCIPEPSGIGAPYFHDCNGVIFSSSVSHLDRQQIADLLVEGIIFRVTRILEDFQQLYDIDRAYLSGGLSSLPSIQQGIALCSPVAVNILLQKETSLRGAAILAGGTASPFGRQVAHIQTSNKTPVLADKYESWKTWFDDYLNLS